MRVKSPQGSRLENLKFESLSKAQKRHWKESMEGKLTTMKWAGAALKMIPRALLVRLRSDVTHRNENTAETATRIESFLRSVTDEARSHKRSLLQEHYEGLGGAAVKWRCIEV